MEVITQEHIDLAKKLGACSVRYRVGQPISEVAQSDLAWMAEKSPDVAEKMAQKLSAEIGATGVIPLPLFGYGSGYGDGDGYGYGYGDGDVDGDGYGYGYGDKDVITLAV